MESTFSKLENEILVQIIEVAEENDGVISLRDYVNSGREPDIETIIDVFGTWNHAVRIADYVPYTEVDVNLAQEDIVRQIRELYEEQGGRITLELYKTVYKKDGIQQISNLFGSWKHALRVANVESIEYEGITYSKEEIIQNIRGLYEECKAKYYSQQNYIDSQVEPNIKMVLKEFGTWENVLKEAGLPLRGNAKKKDKKIVAAKKEVVKKINKLQKEFRGRITESIYKNSKRTPNFNTLIKCFGTWQNALREAGVYQDTRAVISDEDVVKFKEYAIHQMKLHAAENKGEIGKQSYMESGRYPAATSIVSVFGSWSKALAEANLVITTKRNSNRYPDDEKLLSMIVQAIQDFYKETGSLSEKYYKELNKTPSATTIRRKLGNWDEALKVAGLFGVSKKSPELKKSELEAKKELMIQSLTEFYNETGKTSENLYKKQFRKPSATSIRRVFGDWQKALEYAKLPKSSKRKKD